MEIFSKFFFSPKRRIGHPWLRGGVIVFSIILAVTHISCKKDESLPPEVKYISPFELAAFDVGDTISVIAEIRSEYELEEVSVELIDPNGLTVQEKITFKVDGYFYRLEVLFPIYDVTLDDGIYQLRIRARDTELVKSKYLDVRVYALPRELEGYVLMTRLSSDRKGLLLLNSDLTVAYKDTLSGDHLGHLVMHQQNQVISCGITFGSLLAYDLDASQILWKLDPVPNPPSPFFTSLDPQEDRINVSFFDGFVRTYQPGGSLQVTIEAFPNYVPGLSMVHEGLIYIDEASRFGPEHYLRIYYYPSGAFRSAVYPGLDTKGLFPAGDEFVWLGNDESAIGKLLLLDIETHAYFAPLSFPQISIQASCARNENDFFISTTQGIFWYRAETNSLIEYNLELSPHHLVFDDEYQVLMACQDSSMFFLSFPAGNIITEYIANAPIFDASPIYTR